MSLGGPSRTIIVEPIQLPRREPAPAREPTPAPAPPTPEREPDREPVPAGR